MNRYLIEIIFFLITVFVSKITNKKLKQAIKEERYDFGIYGKITPLYGAKAVRLGKIMLAFSKLSPWLIALLLIAFELIYIRQW